MSASFIPGIVSDARGVEAAYGEMRQPDPNAQLHELERELELAQQRPREERLNTMTPPNGDRQRKTTHLRARSWVTGSFPAGNDRPSGRQAERERSTGVRR